MSVDPPTSAFPVPETSFSGQPRPCECCPFPGDWPEGPLKHPMCLGTRDLARLPAFPRVLPPFWSSPRPAVFLFACERVSLPLDCEPLRARASLLSLYPAAPGTVPCP